MQRLIVVYNPNSSQYIHVRDEFLVPVTKLKGFMVGKFAIKKAPFEENLKELEKILKNGDIVIAAGGDATAAVAANAIIESGKDITLGVLPYGNFNDLARTLGTMDVNEMLDFFSTGGAIAGGSPREPSGGKQWRQDPYRIKKLYPLNIVVDDCHWRYATCYITMGMTAEAVELFDNPKIRKKMQEGHRSSWRSYVQLATWYFKNRKKKIFIPRFKLNGVLKHKKTSDYAAVNGRSMSRVMKGGDDYLKPKVFRSETEQTIKFRKLFVLMAKSILCRVPGTKTSGDLIEFLEPATIELQAEGEYKIFENVRTIKIKKSDQYIKIIHGRMNGK